MKNFWIKSRENQLNWQIDKSAIYYLEVSIVSTRPESEGLSVIMQNFYPELFSDHSHRSWSGLEVEHQIDDKTEDWDNWSMHAVSGPDDLARFWSMSLVLHRNIFIFRYIIRLKVWCNIFLTV